MSFEVAAAAYHRLIGRYSVPLAPRFADFAGVGEGVRVLDVGCGPGQLTAELASRGAAVAAVDPSQAFVAACAGAVPEADVRAGSADALPWADATFDAVLSQLVLNFVPDPDAAVRELARVTRPGGTVAACTWDRDGGFRMITALVEAAHSIGAPMPHPGSVMDYRREAELADLWRRTELDDVETTGIEVEARYDDFDDYWGGFLTGIGPDGGYVLSLDEDARAALREATRRQLGSPDGPFTLTALAWAVRGRR